MLDRIRLECRDELEKGERFEKLFKRLILTLPNFEVVDAWRWKEWPDREKLTKLPLADTGIDIVARLNNNSLVAIQCKCYDETKQIERDDINSFLGVSNEPFDMRWIVATCKWGKKVDEIIQLLKPPVRYIDFHEYDNVEIPETKFKREKRDLLPLQEKAVGNVISRMAVENRGQLIMACGTGKTFTSLRIAERMVPSDAQRGDKTVVDTRNILFLAPSIALVAQARREWLTHTERPLNGMVVCSDHTSGGRGENNNDDIRISELECAVTTNPEDIAAHMSEQKTNVVFCTYQSLKNVSIAQTDHKAPDFDLIIADEAHRTTGIEEANRTHKDNETSKPSQDSTKEIENVSGFQMLHNEEHVRGKKRLYMTATPRVYTSKSKATLKKKGHAVFDMEDYDKFGEVMYRLTFADAVNAGLLSDYRVSMMFMRDDKAVRDLYEQFLVHVKDDGSAKILKYVDVERLVGTAFAINGITEKAGDTDRLPRVLGFANSRKRSKLFCKLLKMKELHKILSERMQDSTASMHEVVHVDGLSSAHERNKALRELGSADDESPHMICNVKLFSEGVDVPTLDAVAFMDPRDSMVDVVQAVGRVMRKAPSKRVGHIVIPVPLKHDTDDVAGELESKDDWQAVGRVLRALQSHDSRLPENPAQFIKCYDPLGMAGDDDIDPSIGGFQSTFEFEEFSEKFYSKVVANSGLAKPGQMVTDEIDWAVTVAGKTFQKSADLDEKLANVLELEMGSNGYGSVDICKIAALLVINACLLHRRLQDKIDGLAKLGDINGSENPRVELANAWSTILEKDYAPVFEPALNVVEALPDADKDVKNALYRIVDRANAMADSLSDLGYDHAGPLYHKILGKSAKSDSAYYTINVSAIMLARLALSDKFTDWNDMKKITKLRIIDPACGTGTLLMAALKTIKDRMNYDEKDDYVRAKIHSKLVENTLCGLDINRYAVQIAACNLTLGAPTIDYKNMNLYTMSHGTQPGTDIVKAGSVELLRATSDRDEIQSFVQPLRAISDMQSKHVDGAKPSEEFPICKLDMVIMNPPFGNNTVRGRKFEPQVVKRMQENELAIKSELTRRNPDGGNTIDSNSIRTFFTPLADRLLDAKHGTLAEIIPATACTGVSGVLERKFIASKYHVERIITSHDPKAPNFSHDTGIHECLMVCRRYEGDKPPTEFVSLQKMPKNTKEAIESANAITTGKVEGYGSVHSWPSDLIEAGNWTPVQWYDNKIPHIIHELEKSPILEPIGKNHSIEPAGRRINDAYEECDLDNKDAVLVFRSINSDLRKTIHAVPESWQKPKQNKIQLAKKYWEMKSNLLVAQRFGTVSSRLVAIYSDEPSVGNGWVPVMVRDKYIAKALAVWWNSTPSIMMLLNRRSKMLTYPKWSLEQLCEIRVPKSDDPNLKVMKNVYDQICDMEILQLKHAVKDPVRKIIDEAVVKVFNSDPKVMDMEIAKNETNKTAKVFNINSEAIADWRERLAQEPTITNTVYKTKNETNSEP